MFGVSSAKIENSYQFQTKTDLTIDSERKKNYDGSLENGDITHFYFKKLKEQEMALSLIISINLYLIVFQTNLSFPQVVDENMSTLQLCHYFTIICLIVSIAILTMRSFTMLHLQKAQKQIYERASLITTKKLLYLICQWTILLLQPYPFLINTTLTTANAYADYHIEYPINDILAILSFARIYILIRTALILTPYMNNRSNRLCKMYGCRADFSYALKCMFKDHPLKLICTLYFLIAGIFAYMIYLAERQLLFQNNGSFQADTCTDYPNALWLILITTTTVGYGDYYPQTPLGRIIILFVAIWGTLIVSIMVVVVSNTLSMQKSELRTSRILNKLDLRLDLQNKASSVIGYFMMSHFLKDKPKRRVFVKKMLKAKNQFSEARKVIKQMAEINDLQDEIATHFLKLNSDIHILNSNQDKIIEYIHQNFNAKAKQAQSENETDSDSSQFKQQQQKLPKFMELFKKELKIKMA